MVILHVPLIFFATVTQEMWMDLGMGHAFLDATWMIEINYQINFCPWNTFTNGTQYKKKSYYAPLQNPAQK
mgnify:CR=1 FL=1